MPQIVGLVVLILVVVSPLFVILHRRISGWPELEALYPSVEPIPSHAHCARHQSVSVGRVWFPGVVSVSMTDDTLWLSFSWPLTVIHHTVEVPLADVTLYTGEDWASGGARMRFAGAPDLVVTLGGDGAQMLIARLG